MKKEPEGQFKLYSHLISMLPIAVVVAIGLLIFGSLFESGVILFSTDNNIGNEAGAKWLLPAGIFGAWSSTPFVGFGGAQPANWTSFWLCVLPLPFYINWIHYLDLVVASYFFILTLTRRGLRQISIIVGSLVAFWIGPSFCLVYSGHNGKFALLTFMAIALFCIQEATKKESVSWAFLAGGAIGVSMLEQQDVTVFFGIFWVAYAVYSIVRTYEWRLTMLLKLLMPMAVAVMLIGVPGSLKVYFSQTEGVTAGSGETPNAKWEFVTQWSLPPDECISIVAPGYMGWRSGEPEGPYWGRKGRSAEWEQTRQGFMNFKLDDEYMGVVAFVFPVLALIVAWGRFKWANRLDSASSPIGLVEVLDTSRHEVIFWGGVAVVSFLLALGKFFPLYHIFFQLPIVNNVRGPVKFMLVMQFALGILTAYGIDICLRFNSMRSKGLAGE